MKYSNTQEYENALIRKVDNDTTAFIHEKKKISAIEDKFSEVIDLLKTCYDAETISKCFAYALISEHRTNQQATIKNLFNAFKFYAEHAGTDPRNEEAVKWAKSATEKETYFPYI